MANFPLMVRMEMFRFHTAGIWKLFWPANLPFFLSASGPLAAGRGVGRHPAFVGIFICAWMMRRDQPCFLVVGAGLSEPWCR